MRAILSAIAILSITANVSASYQFGTVTELIVKHERATFQIDTVEGGDIREACLDINKPLNFIIDLSQPGGQALLDQVVYSKQNGTSIGVNGDGRCVGSEFEYVEALAPYYSALRNKNLSSILNR